MNNNLVSLIKNKKFDEANDVLQEKMKKMCKKKLLEMKKIIAAKISEGINTGASNIRNAAPKPAETKSFADSLNKRVQTPERDIRHISPPEGNQKTIVIDPKNYITKKREQESQMPFVKDKMIYGYPNQEKGA